MAFCLEKLFLSPYLSSKLEFDSNSQIIYYNYKSVSWIKAMLLRFLAFTYIYTYHHACSHRGRQRLWNNIFFLAFIRYKLNLNVWDSTNYEHQWILFCKVEASVIIDTGDLRFNIRRVATQRLKMSIGNDDYLHGKVSGCFLVVSLINISKIFKFHFWPSDSTIKWKYLYYFFRNSRESVMG